MVFSSDHNFFKKRVLAMFLVVAIVSSSFLPIFTPRAHAFLGIGDFGITIDVKALLRTVVDGAAMVLAQKMIDQMVMSTITWANSGFEGSPAYLIDTEQYFLNLADNIAGEFIEGSDLNFLCTPFKDTIRLSLIRNYYQPPQTQFRCPISQVAGNINDFYQDFDQGGWQTWFEMTQSPSGNPFNAYITANAELANRIDEEVSTKQQELGWNQGFLSWAECIKKDPKTGECLERGPVQTPGTTIKAQLDKVLPSGLEKLITVNHVEQLVGAFANGLLTRYVFGPKGLFGSDYSDHYRESGRPSEEIEEPDIEDFVRTLPGYEGGESSTSTSDEEVNNGANSENGSEIQE